MSREITGSTTPVCDQTFPIKLQQILSNPELRHIISWMPDGLSWKIHQQELFVNIVMPQYFEKQSRFTSFTRQVNGWGFKRITQGEYQNAYCNELFNRDQPHLISSMKRLKSVNPAVQVLKKRQTRSLDDEHVRQCKRRSDAVSAISDGKRPSPPSSHPIESHPFVTSIQSQYYQPSYFQYSVGRNRTIAPCNTYMYDDSVRVRSDSQVNPWRDFQSLGYTESSTSTEDAPVINMNTFFSDESTLTGIQPSDQCMGEYPAYEFSSVHGNHYHQNLTYNALDRSNAKRAVTTNKSYYMIHGIDPVMTEGSLHNRSAMRLSPIPIDAPDIKGFSNRPQREALNVKWDMSPIPFDATTVKSVDSDSIKRLNEIFTIVPDKKCGH